MIRPVHTICSIVAAAVGVALLGVAAPASALTAPAAPSAVTASFASGSVALAWVDNSPDEAGFAIERCLGAGCTSFGQIATVAAGVTSYSDTFYSSGTDRYRVRAFNSAGYSVDSNTAEVNLVSTGDVVPSMSATPTAGIAPLTVGFDGSTSTAINGTITGYTWSFGDGLVGSGVAVSHTYTTPGVYAASLKVTTTGTFGGSVTASTALLVTVAAPPLVAPGDLVFADLDGKNGPETIVTSNEGDKRRVGVHVIKPGANPTSAGVGIPTSISTFHVPSGWRAHKEK